VTDHPTDNLADKIQDKNAGADGRQISIQISEEMARQIAFLAKCWGKPAVRHNTPVITRCVERAYLIEMNALATAANNPDWIETMQRLRQALHEFSADPDLYRLVQAPNTALARARQAAASLEKLLSAPVGGFAPASEEKDHGS